MVGNRRKKYEDLIPEELDNDSKFRSSTERVQLRRFLRKEPTTVVSRTFGVSYSFQNSAIFFMGLQKRIPFGRKRKNCGAR